MSFTAIVIHRVVNSLDSNTDGCTKLVRLVVTFVTMGKYSSDRVQASDTIASVA